MTANPENREEDDGLSTGLYRACDWSAPRSWLVLLGLGLMVGAVCGLLGGMMAVLVFGRPVASIDAELLAYAAPLTIKALIAYCVIWAMLEAALNFWEQRDSDIHRSFKRIESFRGRAILAILQLMISLPLLAAATLVFRPDNPGGSDFSALGFLPAVIVAISMGPYVILTYLERVSPQRQDVAD